MSDLVSQLNKLKLYGMKESMEYRLSDAMKSNLPYQDLLALLFEDEYLYRENKRSEMLRKRARFNDRVTLEEFVATPERGINKSMIKQMQSLKFMSDFENIIFIGGTGVGKTFLAQAIGHSACQAGKDTIFIPVNILFSQVAAAEAAGTYLTYLRRLTKAHLLILDDFALRNYSHKEATILYQILEDRYRKGATIITSQVRFKGWRNLFEDAVIAEAIVDRMVSCAHEIEIRGETFRNNYKPKKKMAVDA